MNKTVKKILVSITYRGRCFWTFATAHLVGRRWQVDQSVYEKLYNKAGVHPGTTVTHG
jgi:hypothetical protein